MPIQITKIHTSGIIAIERERESVCVCVCVQSFSTFFQFFVYFFYKSKTCHLIFRFKGLLVTQSFSTFLDFRLGTTVAIRVSRNYLLDLKKLDFYFFSSVRRNSYPLRTEHLICFPTTGQDSRKSSSWHLQNHHSFISRQKQFIFTFKVVHK